MEDPATWGPVEWLISEALEFAEQDEARGYIGLSQVRQIADALRDHGLIDVEAEIAQGKEI